MLPSDLFLAAMLLSAPAGTPEESPPPERWAAMQSAIHETAIDWEILDRREIRYVLAAPEDFQGDLDFLRRRRAELADAPKVVDSARLPTRELMNDYIQFNRAYRRHLENRMVWEADRANVIGEAIRETERLYKLWDAMREARCELHYVTFRRAALQKLRDGLGESAYVTGEMPPFVPDWRFTAVR